MRTIWPLSLASQLLLSGCVSLCPDEAVGPLQATAFVSDYLAFVGLEGTEPVLMVLERRQVHAPGGAKEDYRAAIYDRETHWTDFSAQGRHVASGRAQEGGEPTSFKATGTLATGLTLAAAEELLSLQVEPETKQLHEVGGLNSYDVATATAVLTWGPRRILGHVVHEHLAANALAPMRQQLTGLPFKQLGRLFLRLGHSGLLYVHAEGSMAADEGGVAHGFILLNGKLDKLEKATVVVDSRRLGAGFYTWPESGQLLIKTASGEGTARLRSVEQIETATWLVGGATVSGIGGDLRYGKQMLPAFGVSQLTK